MLAPVSIIKGVFIPFTSPIISIFPPGYALPKAMGKLIDLTFPCTLGLLNMF